ncbi:MAG TPA: class I SAM-dependent methyltransferase [Polyangiaceae bacterium]|nr:class I SAM-dependent methyltransferase [Polyangiaceae bacterium]
MPGPRCLCCHGANTTFWAKVRDVEYRTSDEEFTFLRCEDCGVLFIDPVPADRLREIYPPTYYSYAAPRHSLVFSIKHWLDRRFFRSILRPLAQPSLRVLDVGGGAGFELSTLRDSNPRVRETWVVDLDPEAAAIAERNGHHYFCGRVEDFAPDEKFDVIMMLNLIEHVQDPESVLRKVAALLAPGGLVLLKTPNFDSWDARLFRQRSWTGYHCPRHWVLFSRDSFTHLAERVGLPVKQATYTQGASFWAGSTIAWLAARGLLRVTRERPIFNHPLFGLAAAAFAALDFVRAPFAKTSQMFFVLGRAA